jgi:hypothetical protein
MKDYNFPKFQDFILAQPQNEMFSFFDLLKFRCYNKIKSMLPSQKIKMVANNRELTVFEKKFSLLCSMHRFFIYSDLFRVKVDKTKH